MICILYVINNHISSNFYIIRVQAEADDVLEGKSGIDTIEDLKKLQYTHQVSFMLTVTGFH